MHDAAHARLLCRPNQRFSILHCPVEGHRAMGKANPISIVKSRRTLQALDQFMRAIKVERENPYRISKRVGIVGMARKRAYLLAHRQQSTRDIFARIAKSAGNYVHFM